MSQRLSSCARVVERRSQQWFLRPAHQAVEPSQNRHFGSCRYFLTEVFLVPCPLEQNKIWLTARHTRGAANSLHQKEGSSPIMEEHKFEVAVGITGLKIFLATTNPWLLAFGVVAVG